MQSNGKFLFVYLDGGESSPDNLIIESNIWYHNNPIGSALDPILDQRSKYKVDSSAQQAPLSKPLRCRRDVHTQDAINVYI